MPVECKSVASVSLSPSGFNHVQLISQEMKNLQGKDKVIETLNKTKTCECPQPLLSAAFLKENVFFEMLVYQRKNKRFMKGNGEGKLKMDTRRLSFALEMCLTLYSEAFPTVMAILFTSD